MPKVRQVGKAGGTLIVIKSKHRMTTSSGAMRSSANLSINVGRETKKEIKATAPRMRINFPESFLKESYVSYLGYIIERIKLPFKVSNPIRMTMHSRLGDTYYTRLPQYITFCLFSLNLSEVLSKAVFTIGTLSPVSMDSFTIALPCMTITSQDAVSPSFRKIFSPKPTCSELI